MSLNEQEKQVASQELRANLLPQALAEERDRLKIRKWCFALLFGGIVWIALVWTFIIATSRLGGMSHDEAYRLLGNRFLILPGMLGITFGMLGILLYSKNSTMDLTREEKKLL